MIINRVFVNKAIRKVLFYLRGPYNYFAGRRTLNRLAAFKKENEIIITLDWPIGSTVYAMSCLDALKGKYPRHHIIVIGSEKNAEVFKSYPQIDRLILLDPKSREYTKLMAFINSPRLCAEGISKGVFNALPKVKRKVAGNPDTLRQQRLVVFHLPEDAPITYHGIKCAPVTAIEQFDKIKDKVVIINPYSKSIPVITKTLYEDICEKLIRGGVRRLYKCRRGSEAG